MKLDSQKVFTTIVIIFFEIDFIYGQSIAEYLCENQPPDTKLQHPEHCDIYLICNNNRVVEMKCDAGVMFNPNTNDCDPNFTDCSSDIGPDNEAADDYEDDEDNEDEGEDNDDGDENKGANGGSDIVNQQQRPPPSNQETPTASETMVCPKTDTEQITFIMHKSDCSTYYLCYHGKPVPFQCSMGMHWSSKQKKCVPKELSECGTIAHRVEGGCPERGIQFMPHPKVCQYFRFCLNGAETIQRCEAFYHWDVNEAKCKLKTMATCYQNLRQTLDTKSVASGNKNG